VSRPGASRRVALITYTTAPRGGVVHTLALAEALDAIGVDVHVYGLDPGTGSFFRPVSVPFTLFPAPDPGISLEQKIFASVDALADGLRPVAGQYDVLHSQDCISARAATRIRDELGGAGDRGGGPVVLRTVHHVDDFSTPALVECQRRAIVEPDGVLVVSDQWRTILRQEFAVAAQVVGNGVDPSRFPALDPVARRMLRDAVGAGQRGMLLSVGGIEPRKGSTVLFGALGLLRARGVRPVLVMIGGHTFQDHRDYRDRALAMLAPAGLRSGADVVQLGTVSEAELGAWFRTADVLAFPSVAEGFGLVALEALAADLPVVASSLPAFGEFLTDGVDALLPPVGDVEALADALHRVLTDPGLRRRLTRAGRDVVPLYTWQASARRHAEIYAAALSPRRPPVTRGPLTRAP
jgi:glycosyltransferase-like protein